LATAQRSDLLQRLIVLPPASRKKALICLSDKQAALENEIIGMLWLCETAWQSFLDVSEKDRLNGTFLRSCQAPKARPY
jgi:hypothetical protein